MGLHRLDTAPRQEISLTPTPYIYPIIQPFRFRFRHLAYFVEGEQFETGTPLSPVIAAAVEDVAVRVLAELWTILETKGKAQHA